jgi:hypothetical protein
MKLIIRGVPIEDVTVEEAAELIARLGGLVAGERETTSDPATNGGPNGSQVELGPRGRGVPPREVVKIPTANKQEALQRFYEEIRIVSHRAMLRLLAAAGASGLDQNELKKKSGVPNIAGFSNSMGTRAKAYGLKKADVLIVDDRGSLATRRINVYRLTPAMLETVRAAESSADAAS